MQFLQKTLVVILVATMPFIVGCRLDAVPEIGIYKTTVIRGDAIKTTFHLESDVPVSQDIVVYVTYDEGNGEFVVIKQGKDVSEDFEFVVNGENASTVTLQPARERVLVSLPKFAKNAERIEVTADYDFKKHLYSVKRDDRSVSR